MSKKWEYLIRPVSYKVEELNKLGQEGWGMCGYTYIDKDDSEIFIFKRECVDNTLKQCPHCEFLEKTFLNHPDTTKREYWLMTEVFVYLHGSDVCGDGQ